MVPLTVRRSLDLDVIKIEHGAHESLDRGACIMEFVAWAAGEPHSDHPACVDPVIASALRSLNDSLSDANRQELKPYIFRVIGTRGSDDLSLKRSWMALDWIVREYTPAWLDLAKLSNDAAALRALPEITQITVAAALPTIQSARKRRAAASAAAWDAAWAAAWDAVRAAAWAAAWDAVRAAALAAAGDAAGDAAWDAVRAAALAAAGDAAGDAAWDAAWAAAGAAAGDALRPTSVFLRKSFLSLIDRMIEVRE